MALKRNSSTDLHEVNLTDVDVKRLARKAIEILAALRELPWELRVSAFGAPFTLQDEMKRLDYMLDRPTLDPAMIVGAAQLRGRLASTLPGNPRIGCVHGDFEWANILYDDRTVPIMLDELVKDPARSARLTAAERLADSARQGHRRDRERA